MFEIFRKNYCVLDVHKTWIYACIGMTDDNELTEYKQARFSSFSKGLRDLMESSGKYWIPIFNILEKPVLSLLLIPNISSRKQVIRLTVRMLK